MKFEELDVKAYNHQEHARMERYYYLEQNLPRFLCARAGVANPQHWDRDAEITQALDILLLSYERLKEKYNEL